MRVQQTGRESTIHIPQRSLMLSSLSLIALAILAAAAPAAAAGGTIEGRAVYTGTPKRNPLIRMGADPVCLTINAGKKVTQELIALHDDGSLGLR